MIQHRTEFQRQFPHLRAEAERALRVGFAAHLAKPAAKLTKQTVVNTIDAMAMGGASAMAGRNILE